MPKTCLFQFGGHACSVFTGKNLPRREDLFAAGGPGPGGNESAGAGLVVCDENTRTAAEALSGGLPVLSLPPGEEHKSWPAVESILRAAENHGLGRDGLFIGAGGGVVCDLTAFAASVYMRGAALVLVPTTLLCMADASVGGKTGFDLGGFKNLAGTFYPARAVFIAGDALEGLPPREWKSGMAELIKTAVLDRDPSFFGELRRLAGNSGANDGDGGGDAIAAIAAAGQRETIRALVERALRIKGAVVEADPREHSGKTAGRALLNLGHTFGHALESALGLGVLTHGEAVAWGMARSCELGLALGITPPDRAEAITGLLEAWGYELAPDPLNVPGAGETARKSFYGALMGDKKKKAGKPRFVVPAGEGAVLVDWSDRVEAFIIHLLCA